MKFAKLLKTKYNNIPVAARASLWFVLCSMLQKCISVITVPIFTRLMPVEEYGLFNTYSSWNSIITVFCVMSMHNCVFINNYSKAESDGEKAFVPIPLLSLAGTVTFILFVVYLIFHQLLDGVIGLPMYLTCVLFLQALFEPPVLFWTMQQRFEYKYTALVVRTLTMLLANSVLGILLVYLASSNQGTVRIITWVAIQASFGCYFYFYFWKRARKVFSTHDWKRTLKIQLPMVPHALSITVLSSSDRIMINNLISSSATAIYSVAYSAGYIVNVLKNSIVDSLKPWIYTQLRSKNYSRIKKITNSIMVFVTLITILFTAFAPEVISLMAPSKYHEAVFVIPPVAASSFFTFIYNLFSIVSVYFEKTKKIMWASIFGATINITLNLLLIPFFGYIAAAYTTLISYVFFSFAHYFIMRKICKSELNGIIPYDIRFIGIMSIIVIVISSLFSLVYKYNYIRYGIILFAIAVIAIKRKYFLDTIKSLKKRKNRGVTNDFS